MKLLVYQWNSFLQYDLFITLNKLRVEYDVFEYDFSKEGRNKNYDETFVKIFCNNYSSNEYDAIFSISYFAALSDAAMASGMKYISWSYDCPLDTIDPFRTFGNICNYMFLFDREQTNEYISQGLDTVYYMPLGINQDRYSAYTPSSVECDPYRTDISFVGSLYLGSSVGIKKVISNKTADMLDHIVSTQQKLPQKYILHDLVTDSFVQALNGEIEALNPEINGNLSRSHVENTLAHEVTGYNRMMLLMLLGKRWNTNLYTSSSIDNLPGINILKPLDYWTEMPWCFSGSKINLNSTFISITSALPLRVLDIMASGGFLLSNRQPEFETLGYVDGEDVSLFTTFDEAIEKASFYLSHENLRQKVAKNGRKKTFEHHSLEQRLVDIFNIVFG